jgi:DNA-directed RNA polymerase specialized sigma24 family protein
MILEELLRLAHLDGYTVREIASRFGLPQSEVMRVVYVGAPL